MTQRHNCSEPTVDRRNRTGVRSLTRSLVLLIAGLWALGPMPARAQPYPVLETEHFVVHYAEPQEKLARNTAVVAEEAYVRISGFLGTELDGRISLFIAPDRATFRRATAGWVPDWGVGLAVPARRQILITSPAASPAQIDLREIVTHEVAHVLLGASLPGRLPPRWFDEGHAMYHAREWRIAEGTRMVWALLGRTLIPLGELETTFPHGRASAELAYTESYTAVEFLLKSQGPQAFRDFVRLTADTGDFEAALIEMYGWNLSEFEHEWRSYLRRRYPWAVLPALLLTVPGVFTLLFLIAYLRKRRRAKQKIAAWREEDRRTGRSSYPLP